MIRCYVTDRRAGNILEFAKRAIEDGIDFIQVREKDLSARDLLRLVSNFRDMARGTRTRVLVNDRVDIALAAGIDGVHLPGNSLPVERVRRLVSIVGKSTHSIEEALAAERGGADFIVFGPVFKTPGKTPAGLGALRAVAAAVRIPVLAIGGITPADLPEIAASGAAGFAAIRMFQMTSGAHLGRHVDVDLDKS